MQANVCRRMRFLMDRLGFVSVTVRKIPESDRVMVTGYDPVDCKTFARQYSLEELDCICRASNIFWRFIT